MPGTRRAPIARHMASRVTPRAIELHVAMGKLLCRCPPALPGERGPSHDECCANCERWYDLHSELNDELRCRPWEWPCVARQGPKHAGSIAMNERIHATMRALVGEATIDVAVVGEPATDGVAPSGADPTPPAR